MTKPCFIYAIKCLPTGREYVGSTVKLRCRWNTHKKFLSRQTHGNPRLQRAWNKYGADQFEFRVLEQCLETERERRETFWIQARGAAVRGFNLSGVQYSAYATLGMLGKKHSAESRAKMRAARLGVMPWNKGKSHSEETRQKLRSAMLGDTRNKGKKHSEATRLKQRMAKLGKPLSEEHRLKLAEVRKKIKPRKGFATSPETKAKLREAQLAYWEKKRANAD